MGDRYVAIPQSGLCAVLESGDASVLPSRFIRVPFLTTQNNRIQAAAGPVTDKALAELLFRASHGVLQSLAPYPREQRAALLPSVVRILLATFLEEVVGGDGSA